jgi:hypothetical protein
MVGSSRVVWSCDALLWSRHRESMPVKVSEGSEYFCWQERWTRRQVLGVRSEVTGAQTGGYLKSPAGYRKNYQA